MSYVLKADGQSNVCLLQTCENSKQKVFILMNEMLDVTVDIRHMEFKSVLNKRKNLGQIIAFTAENWIWKWNCLVITVF